MSSELPVPLVCCNFIEALVDGDPVGPCSGAMQPGWPEYVCDKCRARCGAQVHPMHALPARHLRYPCATENCPGDGRYAPPGRGHVENCGDWRPAGE